LSLYLMQKQLVGVLEAAASGLRNLAFHSECVNAIITAGAIAVITGVLHTSKAGRSLVDPSREAFASMDGRVALSAALVEALVGCLRNLLLHDRARLQMRDQVWVINMLAEVISDGSSGSRTGSGRWIVRGGAAEAGAAASSRSQASIDGGGLLCEAIGCLRNLAMEAEFIAPIATSGVVPSLTKLIKSSNDRDIYDVAASCLNKLCTGAGFASERARQTAVDAGAIPILVNLVDPAVAEEEATMEQEAEDFMANMEKAAVLRQDVVSTLAALAIMPVCQRAIADSGVIRPLALLMQRQSDIGWLEQAPGHESLLQCTLALFLKLSDYPGNRATISAQNVVPVLVAIIRGGEVYGTKSQGLADEIMRNLMGDAKDRGWVTPARHIRGPSQPSKRGSPERLTPLPNLPEAPMLEAGPHASNWSGQHRGSMLGTQLRDDIMDESTPLAIEDRGGPLAIEDRGGPNFDKDGNLTTPQQPPPKRASSKDGTPLTLAQRMRLEYKEPRGGKYAITSPTTIFKKGKAITVPAGALTVKKLDYCFAMTVGFLAASGVVIAIIFHSASYTDPLMTDATDATKWTLHSSGSGTLVSLLLRLCIVSGIMVSLCGFYILRFVGIRAYWVLPAACFVTCLIWMIFVSGRAEDCGLLTMSYLLPLLIFMVAASSYSDGRQLASALFGVTNTIITQGDRFTLPVLLLWLWIDVGWLYLCIMAISGALCMNGDKQIMIQQIILWILVVMGYWTFQVLGRVGIMSSSCHPISSSHHRIIMSSCRAISSSHHLPGARPCRALRRRGVCDELVEGGARRGGCAAGGAAGAHEGVHDHAGLDLPRLDRSVAAHPP
jgi:hypothetical protein